MGTSKKLISFILLGAFLVRLISLNQSLWLDEAINVLAAKNNSFIAMITEYAKGDFHPPGYFIILWCWTHIFGYSEILVRLPSVFFGVLTVLLIYLIGKKIYSESLGHISALFLAINPLHIYYSQEARMYSFAALVVSLNVLLFMNLIKKNTTQTISWAIFIISNILVLSSDYVAYLIFPAQFIFLILQNDYRILKKWIISLIISLALFSVWLPIFLNQLQVGLGVSSSITAWKEVVGSFGIKPLILTFVKFIIGRIDYPNLFMYGLLFLIPGLLFLILIGQGIKKVSLINKQLLLSWLIMPIILGLAISLFIPIYSYFRLLFVLPPFLLLISFGILSFNANKRGILILLVVLVEFICTSIYLFSPTFQREDWKGLVSFISTKADSQILMESSGIFAPFEYYSNDFIKAFPALINFPARSILDVSNLNFLNKNDVYLIDYLVEISDPKRLVKERLLSLGYKEIDIKNFHGVGFVYHFKR